MYIETLKNSGFKEEFTYLDPKKIKPPPPPPHNNNNNNNNIIIIINMYKDKETTDNCNIKVNCHKNRKRKIMWFNPTFCKLVNINIRKYVLELIHKHFNQYKILHKIFNRKTLENSYSCKKNN